MLEQGLELGLLAPHLYMALSFLDFVVQNIPTTCHLTDFHTILFIRETPFVVTALVTHSGKNFGSLSGAELSCNHEVGMSQNSLIAPGGILSLVVRPG